MNTYRVTIKVQSLNINETVTVAAEDEWKARSEAMMAYRRNGGQRLAGAQADYVVEQVS